MLVEAENVKKVVSKVIDGKIPRFAGGVDLLHICLTKMRTLAVIASVNGEPGENINRIVDHADELEVKAFDYELRMEHEKFQKLYYEPINQCVCSDIDDFEIKAHVDCRKCKETVAR